MGLSLLGYGVGSVLVSTVAVQLFGRRVGVCVALFYLNVLAIIVSSGAAASGLDAAPFSDLEGWSFWRQRLLELSLIALGAVVVFEFVRHQAPCARHRSNNKQRVGKAQQQVHATAGQGSAVELQCTTQLDCWRELPDGIFTELIGKLSSADIGSLRGVCTPWFDNAKRTVVSLRPKLFPVKDIVADFPSLQTLDLSNCTHDITPSKLRHLRRLRKLTELNLGCHHRLIASTVTDKCLAELVVVTNLQSLNLAQCVHVGDAGMMSLVYLPSLKSLNISGCVAVTDIGVMMVAQLSHLTSLEMPWCLKVTNIGLKALAPLQKLGNLNISGCQLVTEQGIATLSAFTNLERLSLLNLGYSKVCVTDVALARLSGLSKLQCLNIGGMQLCNTSVTDEGVRAIADNYRGLTQLGLLSLDISDEGVLHLAQLTGLQVLNLRGCSKVSGASLPALAALTGLTDLCLLHNPKLDVDSACLATIARLPKLHVLGLGNFAAGNRVGAAGLAPLAGLNSLSVLSLAFFGGPFGPAACAALGGMTALQHLDLQGATCVDGEVLAAVGRLQRLESLHLSRCGHVDDASLAHLVSLTQLHTLNLSNCFRVGNAGLACLAACGAALTQLLLGQCTLVGDEGVAALGQLPALKVLDLSCCERVTGSGFERWASSSVKGGPPALESLTLSDCGAVTNGGMRAIGRLVGLTKLDLANCGLVTDSGVGYLRNLTMLTSLDVAQCRHVGDGGLSAIAASMPTLATLKLNGCARVTDRGAASLTRLSSLLTLHMDRCVLLTDEGAAQLARLTGLTSLRLSRCCALTDAGVCALSSLSRLSTLSLAHCSGVTDMGLMSLAPLTTLASLEF